MLDVFVGIGFTSAMILFLMVRAIRLDRSEPWFQAFRPKDAASARTQAPWRRNRQV